MESGSLNFKAASLGNVPRAMKSKATREGGIQKPEPPSFSSALELSY